MRSVGIHTQWAELARKRTTRNVVTSLQRLEEAIDCVHAGFGRFSLFLDTPCLYGYASVQDTAIFVSEENPIEFQT